MRRAALYAACLFAPWVALTLPAPAGAIAALCAAPAGAALWLWWTAPPWGRNARPLAFAQSLIVAVSALFGVLAALESLPR